MKSNPHLFVGLLVCLQTIFAQHNNPTFPPVEFFFESINSNHPITFNASATSAVFDTSTTGSYPVTSNYNSSQCTDTIYAGWNFVDSQDGSYPVLALGLYKFHYENSFFYLDLRDQRLAIDSIYTNNDVWFKYDNYTNIFSYNIDGGVNYTDLSNGDYITIWDIKEKGTPTTSPFNNYWSNCLAVVPKYNNKGLLAPFIVWGPIPNFTATGYKVYRSIRTDGMPPGTFFHIATVSSSTFTYLDESQQIGSGHVAYYKVKAFNGSSESDYSNMASISITPFSKHSRYWSEQPGHYVVNQNYPNPFNPSTVIQFYIPVPDIVRIEVTNILGQEIRTLMHSFLTEGHHSTVFNAFGLPSGVYYYTIRVGSITEVKKMMYIR